MAKQKETTTKKTTVKQAKPAKKSAASKVDSRLAVLDINGMQYISKVGETILTTTSTEKDASKVEVKLLALMDIESGKVEFGKPHLENKVEFDLGEIVKGEKVTASKFKAKARYRRKVGHRAKYVQFTLKSIA